MQRQQQTSTIIEGIYFSYLQANGIHHRLASTISNLRDGGAQSAKAKGYPLVLFLHGFPESWYSWRHQLLFLQNQPFLAVAPDMRGYGSTSTPKDVEDYTLPVLVEDVIGIVDVLGYNKFIVVGHDMGANVAWSVALLYPNRVQGVCAMSVPYAGTPRVGMLTSLQQRYGQCLNLEIPRSLREKAKFHYILFHCLPHADTEYNKHTREFLYRIYSSRKQCDIVDGTPEHNIRGLMFPKTGDHSKDHTRKLDATSAPGLWARITKPTTLPAWLTKQDLDYYVNEFLRSEFYGGLCWYRALDMNVELVSQCLADKGFDDKIRTPALFITGEDDMVINMYGGKDAVNSRLKANVLNQVVSPIFIKDCDHWVQQEHCSLVSRHLLTFLNRLLAKPVERQQSAIASRL